MKKLVAIMLSCMMFTAALAGCGSGNGSEEPSEKSNETASQEDKGNDEAETPEEVVNDVAEAVTGGETLPEEYTLAFVCVTSSGGLFGSCANIFEECAKACGFNTVYDVGATSPEDQITSVQNVISAGADAIVFINFTTDCLAKVSSICEENGIYWAQFLRDVTDEDVQALLEQSEYYVGRSFPSEEEAVISALEYLKSKDVKTTAIIGPATGDVTTDFRDNYFQEKSGEYGIEVVTTVRNLTDSTTATDAVSNVFATYPDVDCIYAISGSDGRGQGVCSAIDTLGYKGKVELVLFDFIDEEVEYIDEGIITYGIGGQAVSIAFTTMMLVNALAGTPLSDDVIVCNAPYSYAASSEDIADYFTYASAQDENSMPYNVEEIRNMCKYFNPDLDLEGFLKTASSYSIEDVVSRHGE